MPDKPQKSVKTSDAPSEKGSEKITINPEIAKTSQADARTIKSIEGKRTNPHSGSAGGDADADSITIESIGKDGKKTILASRKTKSMETDYHTPTKELVPPDQSQNANRDNFNTQDWKAIKDDPSLPNEKRQLAEQLDEMRAQAKELSMPTAEIDSYAREALQNEIRQRRTEDDKGTEEAGAFSILRPTKTTPEPININEADNRPIRDLAPNQTGEKTFSLGLAYDENQPLKAPPKNSLFQSSQSPKPESSIGEILAEVGELPLDEQVHVLGMGIKVFQQELARQELEILKGTATGIGEGFEAIVHDAEDLAKNVGSVWQFSEDVLTNNPRALETGAKVGEAIGNTLVGGVKLFQISHDYLFNIGYTGDYGKPFKDISNLAKELDRRWNLLTPGDKARLTAKFSTQFLGEAAIPLGATKLSKSEKVTAALEEIAARAKVLGGKTSEKVVDGIANVVDGLTDMVTPTEELATADGPMTGRRKLSDLVNEKRQLAKEAEMLKVADTEATVATTAESTVGRKLAQPITGDDGISKEDFLEKLSEKEHFLDLLENMGFGNKRRLEKWKAQEVERLAELPNPLDAKYSIDEAAKIAVDRMVKPWGLENPKVKEHYDLCKQTLLDSIPAEDIMTLYGKGGDEAFSIHYPNKVSDFDFGLAKEKAFDTGKMKVEHLGGVTVPDQKLSCVPRLRRDTAASQWIRQEKIPETSEFREFIPEGVVRHEVGMCLMDRLGWKTPKVLELYNNSRVKLKWHTEELIESYSSIQEGSEEHRTMQQAVDIYSRLKNHLRTDGTGIEQVLADLYAIKYGGSCYGVQVDKLLIKHFGEITEHL